MVGSDSPAPRLRSHLPIGLLDVITSAISHGYDAMSAIASSAQTTFNAAAARLGDLLNERFDLSNPRLAVPSPPTHQQSHCDPVY